MAALLAITTEVNNKAVFLFIYFPLNIFFDVKIRKEKQSGNQPKLKKSSFS